MTAVPSKHPYRGLGCVLFLVVGVTACIKLHLPCLLIPCDRPLTVAVSPVDPEKGRLLDCSLALYRSPEIPKPIWKHRIEEGQAHFVVGPWAEQYAARVHCPGYDTSQVLQVELGEGEDVSLGSVTMSPAARIQRSLGHRD